MQITVDPEIPEWGNPVAVMGGYHVREYIARMRRTGRTETSQYPQEKKANAIPSVAASERGEA